MVDLMAVQAGLEREFGLEVLSAGFYEFKGSTRVSAVLSMPCHPSGGTLSAAADIAETAIVLKSLVDDFDYALTCDARRYLGPRHTANVTAKRACDDLG